MIAGTLKTLLRAIKRDRRILRMILNEFPTSILSLLKFSYLFVLVVLSFWNEGDTK